MEEHEMFCFKCGNKAEAAPGGSPPPKAVCANVKSAGLSTVLSLIWMGLGQLYTGKIGRGLLLMLLHCAMFVIGIKYLHTGWDLLGFSGFILVGVLFTLAWIGMLIWNVVDATNLADKYNDAMRMSGRRPW